MGLSEVVGDPGKKGVVVDDCCTLVDEEVASKGGLSGLAVKAGYAAVKGVKPGFIRHVVSDLLPEFAEKIDPIWQEGVTGGSPAQFLVTNKARVADALLSVTDAKAQHAKSAVVRGTYEKLRGTAKKNVEDAIPRLSKLVEKHVK
jgi:hypothetical protein